MPALCRIGNPYSKNRLTVMLMALSEVEKRSSMVFHEWVQTYSSSARQA
jgi:hypothetical protein